MTEAAPQVRAAGGVIWRRGAGGGREWAVIHRPKYDDWSLPKGKLEPGESLEEGALREVREETGLRCRLGPHAGTTRYLDNAGRTKTVDYWLMEAPAGDGVFEPNNEVDELRWLGPDLAAAMLSHEHDRELLARADAIGGS
ncbi:MAG TPA: NUDIX hydrolase [Candidatus Dormibacteraeota bacterium]|jgi:8-oxo-dGTP diphosphatase|nr:NUDIX hydrolase [Candidatus Dormibacteraeota bacterium]